jgi:site-specific DNA-cytosine methylase
MFFYITSLFAGIGSCPVAFKEQKIIAFTETDRILSANLKKNFPDSESLRHSEDYSVYIGHINMVTASFQSITDKQMTFWVNVIRETDPLFLLAEFEPKNETKITNCLKKIISLGYDMKTCILDSRDYGLPYSTKRGFLIGSNSEKFSPSFPEKTSDVVINHNFNFDMENAVRVSGDLFDGLTCVCDMNNEDGKEENINLNIKRKQIINLLKPVCDGQIFVPLKNKHGFFVRRLTDEEWKKLYGFPVDFQIIDQRIDFCPPSFIHCIIDCFKKVYKL